jgi:hypothetical protein
MPAALKTWLDAGNQAKYWSDLITLTLADGVTVYRWHSGDTSVVYLGNTYWQAGVNAPAARRGQYNQGCRGTIDTMDVQLLEDQGDTKYLINGKALPLLAAQGFFDGGARLQIDYLLGPDLQTALFWGPIPKLFEGRIAGLDPAGSGVTLRAKSEIEALNILLPKFPLQPQCGNAVYDANCGLSRAAFTLTGTASGVPTKTTIPTASGALTAKAAGYFELGVLSFTSGPNAGSRRAVQLWTANTFTVSLPFNSTPAAGDAISVYPGCDRSKLQCGPAKFTNLPQYRGFPHIPAPEAGA